MKDRIYVCHTFYHVYISVIKELNIPVKMRGTASIVLSTMSNDFGDIDVRLRESGIFEDVYFFDEQEDVTHPEVMKYHKDRGNVVLNLLQRVKYTRMLARAQEKYVPVDFSNYKDIYVFCDSDPIGTYLNYKHIYYHALEDGLDTLVGCDSARVTNRGHFKIKSLMAKLNLIFIENGHSKYCLDMEVNNIEPLIYKQDNYIEVPRINLIKGVAECDKHYLMDIFIEDAEELKSQLEINKGRKRAMILTDPVCDLQTRARITRDIIERYCEGMSVFLKVHPRDVLDYESEEFADCTVIKGKFPMEVMNLIPELHMDRVISIFTVLDAIEFADEKIRLGCDFMDEYEAPEIHRENVGI